jgi:enoyl-CoA hydratase/carnithine racemase
MDLTTLLIEKADGVAKIIFNRPAKLNAINFVMIDELWNLLHEVRDDDEIRVVVFTGAGKYFSSGADLDILSTLTPKSFRKMQHQYWNKLYNFIESFDKLTIAAVNGPVIGGGVELILCCDIRYAVDDATFLLPQINYGIIPDAGGTIRLPLLIGLSRAKELILSGEPIGANQAEAYGLVNHVYQTAGFNEKVHQAALKFAKKPPLAMQWGKHVINKGFYHRNIQIGLQDAMDAQTDLIKTSDYHEGIAAFREKRKPVFKGI